MYDTKICPICRKQFIAERWQQKYCSKECRDINAKFNRFKDKPKKVQAPTKYIDCDIGITVGSPCWFDAVMVFSPYGKTES